MILCGFSRWGPEVSRLKTAMSNQLILTLPLTPQAFAVVAAAEPGPATDVCPPQEIDLGNKATSSEPQSVVPQVFALVAAAEPGPAAEVGRRWPHRCQPGGHHEGPARQRRRAQKRQGRCQAAGHGEHLQAPELEKVEIEPQEKAARAQNKTSKHSVKLLATVGSTNRNAKVACADIGHPLYESAMSTKGQGAQKLSKNGDTAAGHDDACKPFQIPNTVKQHHKKRQGWRQAAGLTSGLAACAHCNNKPGECGIQLLVMVRRQPFWDLYILQPSAAAALSNTPTNNMNISNSHEVLTVFCLCAAGGGAI